ncbi:MAG: hypothetical protein WAQ28_07340 [Bacteroidia bacterium]
MSFSAPSPKIPAAKPKDVPMFILQGGVKLNGRPAGGAVLTLTRDGKTIAKMITPKSGLYYFQMNRSMTDPQSEYVLNILKDGIASGVIRINTYTPKEQFTAVPYMFNLDIALKSPVNSGNVVKKDFGRIAWLAERNVFDFDKGYIPVDEEKVKADSVKLVEKIKEEKELKRQADSISEAWTVAAEAEAIKKKAAKEKAIAEKAAAERGGQSKEKEAAEAARIASKTSKVTKAKNKGTDAEPLKNGNAANTVKTSAASGNKEKNSAEIAKTNTVSSIDKSKTVQNSKADPAKKNTIEKNALTQTNTPATTATSASTLENASYTDSIKDARNPKKDLFFLTGVPMEQFKTNLPVGETYSKNTDGYSAEEELIANSERNRLLAARQRYERKKAENFAKKQETNNSLTSLIDAVEEYGKIQKEMKR